MNNNHQNKKTEQKKKQQTTNPDMIDLESNVITVKTTLLFDVLHLFPRCTSVSVPVLFKKSHLQIILLLDPFYFAYPLNCKNDPNTPKILISNYKFNFLPNVILISDAPRQVYLLLGKIVGFDAIFSSIFAIPSSAKYDLIHPQK